MARNHYDSRRTSAAAEAVLSAFVVLGVTYAVQKRLLASTLIGLAAGVLS